MYVQARRLLNAEHNCYAIFTFLLLLCFAHQDYSIVMGGCIHLATEEGAHFLVTWHTLGILRGTNTYVSSLYIYTIPFKSPYNPSYVCVVLLTAVILYHIAYSNFVDGLEYCLYKLCQSSPAASNSLS